MAAARVDRPERVSLEDRGERDHDLAAQEIAPEGAFTVNFTSTVLDPIAPVPSGPAREFGVYQSVLTARSAAGEGLLHSLTGRCLGWFSVDLAAGTYAQETRCFYTDADGDQLWEDVALAPQPLAPVRIAAGRSVGGTGKYDGLRGEFEIRLRPLRPAPPPRASSGRSAAKRAATASPAEPPPSTGSFRLKPRGRSRVKPGTANRLDIAPRAAAGAMPPRDTAARASCAVNAARPG